MHLRTGVCRAVSDTGTRAGVTLGVDDVHRLREGDVMELEIDDQGRRSQTVGQA